ncbi:type II toxin-antitoxin system Phd/YefM family antitoxin [Kribbella sp. NPDC059898]|uniref:type II toxin-antitoxin system Phd/YefM family antitoxin n=1 Tax=Kribbella sp. NPDC059898 TaxID=3346995 RepID=UPI00364D3ECB
MDRIPIRELSQHTRAVLARVSDGQSLEITVRGRPTARIVPIDDNTSIRSDLIRRGRLIPASNPGRMVLPAGTSHASLESTEIVSDLREERL